MTTNVIEVSTGNPPLQPQKLSTGAAASSAWEGTFIEVTGTISAATPSGPGTNYTVTDGSGNVDVRVVDNLGVAPFGIGEVITARGAGGQFQTTYQVLVGRAADVFVGSGEDTTPPTLTDVTALTATQMTVRFSERVTAATAEVAGNYVFETATPANVVPVTAATLAGDALSVTLTLGRETSSRPSPSPPPPCAPRGRGWPSWRHRSSRRQAPSATRSGPTTT